MMKSVVWTITISLLLALPAASAFTYHAGSAYGWQQANSWNHRSYQYMPSHQTYGYQRPEGYGLTVEQGPAYPPVRWHNGRYCENQRFIGHTSAWSPGTYYSGITGYARTPPRYRSNYNNCPPTHGINNNIYRAPYW